MQDNGTTQMANFSTTCLEKAISKQLITHKLWAPVSPDLNLLLLFLTDNEKEFMGTIPILCKKEAIFKEMLLTF